MDTAWRTALWPQFGAAIDMLGRALVACPAALATPLGEAPLETYRGYGISVYLALTILRPEG